MDSDPTQRGPWASWKTSFPNSRTPNSLNPKEQGQFGKRTKSGSELLGPLADVPDPTGLLF